MKTIARFAMAALCLSGAVALAADDMPACAKDSKAAPMRDRMGKMNAEMKRIHETKDPAERSKLMDEHMKKMHEGMGDMRMKGGAGKECRMEMMDGMMGQMKEHRRAMQEPGG